MKRRNKEQAAIKELEILARTQADEKARLLPRSKKYTPEIAKQIIALVSDGVPIQDSVLNGVVIAPGIATRLGIAPSTFYEWQIAYCDLADGIARARQESAHRIADRMLSLADAALAKPELANAVRVAADIQKWQAMVRNRQAYGNTQADVTVNFGITVDQALGSIAGDLLAKVRVVYDQEAVEGRKLLS